MKINKKLLSIIAFAPSEWSDDCVFIYNNDKIATIQGIKCIIINIFSITFSIIGIAGFLVMIFSGIKLMLSAGNPKAAEDAKNSISYAVFGLVVALSSFIILNIIGSFTGIQIIKKFTIPNSDTMW